jgi:uncharacterized Zn finger protein
MKHFGRTWWGQQWLASLSDIDQSNRLPRGRRYANNGSVRSIEIGEEGVQARVQGSRRAPYKVKVALAPFSARQRQTVLKAVEASPVLLSRLLNRQLPPHVLRVLEEKKIRLFPRRWGDMRASCSCPDFAMPCKHIAAVVYLIANEIDKNPFLVFSLRGLDLAEALQARSGIQPESLTTLPTVEADWSKEPAFTDFEPPPAEAFAKIDLSRVPAIESRIFTMLAPEPLFHDKDFRKTLTTQYQRARRAALAFDREAGTPWPAAERLDGVTAVIDDKGALVELRANGKRLFRASAEDDDAFAEFLAGLHALPAEREPRLAHSVLLWRTTLRLALKLIEQGALVPRVAVNRRDETLVQWHPARLDATVDALFGQLCALCPPDWVRLQAASGRRKLSHHGDAATQVTAALSLLLGLFMRRGFVQSASAQADGPVVQMFFAGRPQRFDRFETQATPSLIAHWLRRLTLGERAHRLHLRVEEHDSDELVVTVVVEDGERYTGVAEWLQRTGNDEARAAVLADLAVLADYFPDIERLYTGRRDSAAALSYTAEAFAPILTETLPTLRLLGIGVILPRALRKLARPQANLALSSSGNEAAVSYLNLDQLLDFDWQVAIGDQRMSVAAFRKLVQNSAGLVRLRDQYVLVDPGEARQLLDRLARPPQALSRAELLQAGLAGELDGAEVTPDDSARALFEQLIEPQTPPPTPAALEAQLRPYQQRGFQWLAENARLGFGSLLADDMGLGKTLQVIALLAHFKAEGRLDQARALVVVPTSLLSNWRHEIERFAPTLAVQVYHGTKRTLDLDNHDVVLTSYGLIRSDAKALAKPRWAAVVIDEAQNIKNPATAQTKAVKRLHGDARVALSGTPVENRLREYWSLFDFINPGYLRSQKQFAEKLANPIERNRDQSALTTFRRITAPFILRRLKTDKTIIADLPEKIEANRYCALTARQASLYQSTVDAIMAELEGSAAGIERRGLIFKLLNALKQICNSREQFLGRSPAEIDASGKLAAFIELMGEIEAADEKALIFTQYTAMGELLSTALGDTLGIEAPFLHGGRSRKQRDEMVAAFQSERGPRAMVVSLKAGGTGLNLTAASQVIHYDLWWNPAVERQATDRAYRIGQHRNVMVHRLITENTFEEKIDAMIQSKKELAELTMASGEQWITELTDSQLRELVSL